MVILALYKVSNQMGWERHTFDCMQDDLTFKRMWDERCEDIHFYDMESHWGDDDTYDVGPGLLNGDEFEDDYNNEDYDGGWWVKVLHVPSDYVKQVIGYKSNGNTI